jgi:hypothetical protein
MEFVSLVTVCTVWTDCLVGVILMLVFLVFGYGEQRKIRLPEGDAGAMKHVGVLTVYKILFIYIYIYIYICVCVCVLCICWSGKINCRRCRIHTSK